MRHTTGRASGVGPRPLSRIVAENIRAEAARRGLFGRDLAGVVGLSAMAISDRTRGRTPWTLDEVQMIAAAFGLSPAVLVVDYTRETRTAGAAVAV